MVFVVRGNSRLNLHQNFGCTARSFIFFKHFFYQKQCKYAMNIVVAQIKAAGTLPSISKITTGSWCFLLQITAACIVFFKKKSQNDIISPTFVLQVIYFTTSTKITVLSGLTRSEFACRNEFPCKNRIPDFLMLIPIENFTDQRSHPPLNKGEDFHGTTGEDSPTRNTVSAAWRRNETLIRYFGGIYQRSLKYVCYCCIPGVLTFHKTMITMDRKADHMKNNLNYFPTQK